MTEVVKIVAAVGEGFLYKNLLLFLALFNFRRFLEIKIFYLCCLVFGFFILDLFVAECSFYTKYRVRFAKYSQMPGTFLVQIHKFLLIHSDQDSNEKITTQ